MLIRFGRPPENPEPGWGKGTGSETSPWTVRLMIGLLLLLICGGLVPWLLGSGKEHRVTGSAPITGREAIRVELEAAEKVARAFLKETDPDLRLQWARHAEEVKQRIGEYPEEARSAVGEIEKMLGHQEDGGHTLTGFVVKFSTGNVRLLEVVGTAEGPRVDWDACARHGTASWENLLSGKAKQAVVRVFCEPATERPEPFEDQSKWTCFRMSSPDLPQASLGFAAVGSVREEKMKRVILSAPKYRQRFTLEIVRREGKDEPFFEITRCMAVGWIMGERDVEDEWAK
jgi:hypothetical protein